MPHWSPGDGSAVTREAVVMTKAMMEKCILVDGWIVEYRLRIDMVCSVWGLVSDGVIFCWEVRSSYIVVSKDIYVSVYYWARWSVVLEYVGRHVPCGAHHRCAASQGHFQPVPRLALSKYHRLTSVIVYRLFI